MGIPCKARAEHRPTVWVVLGRDVCRLSGRPDLGEWPTPGISTLLCQVCRVAWRSSAKYVAELPDLHPAQAPYVDPVPGRIAELVEAHPLLAELTYRTEYYALAGEDFPFESKRFLHDVGDQFVKLGKLSDRQIAACEMIIQGKVAAANDETRRVAELKAQREALGAALAPEGKLVVVGTVERAWEQEGLAEDPVPKMVLRGEGGWSVEVTVPARIRKQFTALHKLVGREVELYATFRRTGDLTKAWGSWPLAKSRLL